MLLEKNWQFLVKLAPGKKMLLTVPLPAICIPQGFKRKLLQA
jgi:hypothetical protein